MNQHCNCCGAPVKLNATICPYCDVPYLEPIEDAEILKCQGENIKCKRTFDNATEALQKLSQDCGCSLVDATKAFSNFFKELQK